MRLGDECGLVRGTRRKKWCGGGIRSRDLGIQDSGGVCFGAESGRRRDWRDGGVYELQAYRQHLLWRKKSICTLKAIVLVLWNCVLRANWRFWEFFCDSGIWYLSSALLGLRIGNV